MRGFYIFRTPRSLALTKRRPKTQYSCELTAVLVLYNLPSMKTNKLGRNGARIAAGVLIERNGEVLSFVLDNPPENEVTGVMFETMLAELRAEALEAKARVLRIRARGEVFCTGRERAGRDAASIKKESKRIIEFKRALRCSPLISIAEVQGGALGFGFGLAIVCDLVLVADGARLGFPEMKHGLAPSAIMSYLGEYVLPRHAFPLVLFGDAIDAHRAMQIGLVSQVCVANELGREADGLVKRILELDDAACRRCKEFFLTAQQNTFEQNCRLAVETLTLGSLAALEKKTKR